MLVTQERQQRSKFQFAYQRNGSVVLDLGNIYPAESDGKNERQMATIWFWQSGIY